MNFKRILAISLVLCGLTVLSVPANTLSLGNIRITLEKNVVYQLKNEDILSALGTETKFEAVKIIKTPPATSGDFQKNGQAIPENTVISSEELSSVSFTPYPDFLGEVSFSYQVYSGTRVSNEATFTLEYLNTATQKPLEDLYVGTDENISREITLLPKGHNGQIRFVIAELPQHGTLTAKDENYHTVIYTPNKNYVGEDGFLYQELDNPQNMARVTITVSKAAEALPLFVHEDLKNHWVNYSAGNLAERGILCGEMIGGKYYFYPDTKMTRWEYLNYLLASANMNIDTAQTGYADRYEDAHSLPEYIRKIAALATQIGILEGISENGKLYIHPYQELTRAQAVTMLGKLIASEEKSEDKLYFRDRDDIPSWARKHFINLVNYGILQGFPDNTIRPYNPLNKAQTAEMLYQSVKYTEKEPEVLRTLKRNHQYYH